MSDGDRSDDGDAFEADEFGDDASDADPFDDEFPDDDATDADPFAALGGEVEDGSERASGPESAEASPRTEFGPGTTADDPFAELDADASGEPTEEDPFESMGGGDVGEEDVWEALDEGTQIGADATEFGDAGDEGAVGDAGTPGSVGGRTPGPGTTGDERVIDKRSYCQRCPHFAAPPETACTHDGTEIVESVDFSRFRVRNCPMVDADDPSFGGE